MKRMVLAISFVVFVGTFYVVIIALPENVAATTLFVGGSGPGNHTLIQDAIDASFPGDTVFVYNGTYYENLIVSKSISLIGEGRDSTTIDGGGAGVVVNVTTDWVNVTGFTITNSGSGILDDALHIWFSNNCRVEANNISGNTRMGIFLTHSSSNSIQSNVVSGNLHGIYVSDSHDNTIAKNVVSNNTNYGISLGAAHRHYLSGNTLSDNWIAGRSR
jgi:nitrous oxidase accessory protein